MPRSRALMRTRAVEGQVPEPAAGADEDAWARPARVGHVRNVTARPESRAPERAPTVRTLRARPRAFRKDVENGSRRREGSACPKDRCWNSPGSRSGSAPSRRSRTSRHVSSPGRSPASSAPTAPARPRRLRILLGLVRATERHRDDRRRAVRQARPARCRRVGAVLEASSFHPGRTAANHLKVYAQAAGIPRLARRRGARPRRPRRRRRAARSAGSRSACGSGSASRTRCSAIPASSCSTSRRTASTPRASSGCAASSASSPARAARCSSSSHLLAEVQQTVDSLLIISQGRLVFQGALEELADPSEYATVVDSPDRAALAAALTRRRACRSRCSAPASPCAASSPPRSGAIAASAGVALSSLQRRGPALEEVFLDLVTARACTRAPPAARPVRRGGGAAAGSRRRPLRWMPRPRHRQSPVPPQADAEAEDAEAAAIASDWPPRARRFAGRRDRRRRGRGRRGVDGGRIGRRTTERLPSRRSTPRRSGAQPRIRRRRAPA